MKIGLGCDHAGYEYKEKLKSILTEAGHTLQDFGTHSLDSVDYPDFIHPLAESIEAGQNERGIIICGSANGVAITANKHQGIRAAICWQIELAKLCRLHNDSNVVAIPARFIAFGLTTQIVDMFLNTEFEGGRHGCRVDKIAIK